MNKYYVKVDTDCGDMVLSTRAKSDQEAAEKVTHKYHIISVKEVSLEPMGLKTELIRTSPLFAKFDDPYTSSNQKYRAWGY